jgi:DnaJ like chaperone protein
MGGKVKGWSKAVGAGLGYFVGGPIGAVLGYVVGDKLSSETRPEKSHLLTANLLGFAAILLKATGLPSVEERTETVRFISRLFHFDGEDERLAAGLLDQLLAVELDLTAMAVTFGKHSDVNMRMRLMEILATLCLLLYGSLEGRRLDIMSEIAAAVHTDRSQWQAIKMRYRAASLHLDLDCCYALLELIPEASVAEIKAAYRKLAKEYHPDRSAQLNHTALRRHIDRMTLINAAYETIRAQRAF